MTSWCRQGGAGPPAAQSVKDRKDTGCRARPHPVTSPPGKQWPSGKKPQRITAQRSAWPPTHPEPRAATGLPASLPARPGLGTASLPARPGLGITLRAVCSEWPLALSRAHFGILHAPSGPEAHFLPALNNIPGPGGTQSVPPSPAEGRLGDFPVRAVIGEAAGTCVQVLCGHRASAPRGKSQGA